MALKIPSTLKLNNLKSLAFQCGISSSGTKALLTNRLRNEISPLSSYGGGRALSNPIRILSIDMGIRNLAYCLLEIPTSSSSIKDPALPSVTAWKRVAVSSAPSITSNGGPSNPVIKEAFDPATLSSLAYNLLTTTLLPLAPTHVLIERQRFRSMGRAQILEWTVRVNMFESILYAVFHTLRAQSVWTGSVIPITPGKVGPFWLDADAGLVRAIEREKKTRNTKNAKLLNKGAKIDLVKNWLETGEMVEMGSNETMDLAQAYLNKWNRLPGRKPGTSTKRRVSLVAVNENQEEDMGKLDDLADCLLQGMAWVQWERNKALLLEKGAHALISTIDR